jgi:hypothetical protein
MICTGLAVPLDGDKQPRYCGEHKRAGMHAGRRTNLQRACVSVLELLRLIAPASCGEFATASTFLMLPLTFKVVIARLLDCGFVSS